MARVTCRPPRWCLPTRCDPPRLRSRRHRPHRPPHRLQWIRLPGYLPIRGRRDPRTWCPVSSCSRRGCRGRWQQRASCWSPFVTPGTGPCGSRSGCGPELYQPWIVVTGPAGFRWGGAWQRVPTGRALNTATARKQRSFSGSVRGGCSRSGGLYTAAFGAGGTLYVRAGLTAGAPKITTRGPARFWR